jgi:hypothetical protein
MDRRVILLFYPRKNLYKILLITPDLLLFLQWSTQTL